MKNVLVRDTNIYLNGRIKIIIIYYFAVYSRVRMKDRKIPVSSAKLIHQHVKLLCPEKCIHIKK